MLVQPPVQSVVPITIDIIEPPEPDQTTAAADAAVECEVSKMSNYYGHERQAPPPPPSSSSLQQQHSPKSHEEFDNNYLLSDNDDYVPFDLNSKQRLRLLHENENNNDNDTSFLEEEGEEGTEVMNGMPPVDVSRLLLDYSVLSDNNGSVVAILRDHDEQQLQPSVQPTTQQMKSSGNNNNNNNKNKENNTQKKVNKPKKKKDSWEEVMIEFIAPFHEEFGCASDASSDEEEGVQESPSSTSCKMKQQLGQQVSDNNKRGSSNNISRQEDKHYDTRRSNNTTDLSPHRHRYNQAATASCGLIDIEETIANLIAPFYTIEDGVSQELEGIISCGMD